MYLQINFLINLFKIYLINNSNNAKKLPKNCIEKPLIVDADGDGLYLSNGEYLAQIDTVIYCTGYKYLPPPIFDEKMNNIFNEVTLINNHRIVTPLILNCAHAKYFNSIFLIGTINTVIPFLLIEHQVQFALALMNNRIRIETLNFNLNGLDIE